jgi:hypothetical protein
MFWRYLAAGDPNVTVPMLFIDCDDYDLLTTVTFKWGVWKRAFVKFAKDESQKFFVRPNGIGNAIWLPPLTASNWGCKPGALGDILTIYSQYAQQPNHHFGIDEHMLRHRVLPLMSPTNTLTCPDSDFKIFLTIIAQFYILAYVVVLLAHKNNLKTLLR